VVAKIKIQEFIKLLLKHIPFCYIDINILKMSSPIGVPLESINVEPNTPPPSYQEVMNWGPRRSTMASTMMLTTEDATGTQKTGTHTTMGLIFSGFIVALVLILILKN